MMIVDGTLAVPVRLAARRDGGSLARLTAYAGRATVNVWRRPMPRPRARLRQDAARSEESNIEDAGNVGRDEPTTCIAGFTVSAAIGSEARSTTLASRHQV